MTSTLAAKQRPLPEGVYCPVVSLYRSTTRQEIDLESSHQYFSYLIRGGVHALVLSGTTAEAVLLSPTERQDLIRAARKAALDLGLNNYPLVAGISGQSTNESIRLAEDAKAAGADFGLLLPPSYWSKAVTKDVILEFYRDVADESPIPVVVYNVGHSHDWGDASDALTDLKFPGVTSGIDLNSDVLSELAKHPNIVGVKLTCGNAGKVTRLTQEFKHEQFGVYAGQSDWLVPCLAGGGQGCVTGIGNVFPKSVCRLYNLWKEGKVQEAAELQGLVAQAEKACKEGIAATKYGAGYFAGPLAGVNDPTSFHPRRPYKPAGKEMQSWIVNVMKHLVEVENSIPDAYPGKPPAQVNGSSKH